MKSPKFIGTPAERAKQITGLWPMLVEMIDDLPPAEREAVYEHIRRDIEGHLGISSEDPRPSAQSVVQKS